MTDEPISFACKIGLWGDSSLYRAHAKIVLFPWVPQEDSPDPNYRADRNLEPENLTKLLGKSTAGAHLFWFGTAIVAMEGKDLERFHGKAIALVMEDKAVRNAIVVKCRRAGDPTLYFVGLSQWPGITRPKS